MKDSKEKEHRISNLKEMIDSVDAEDDIDEYEEDMELINYLNEDHVNYDELDIDDEFIYRPDDGEDAVNLEDEHINKDFLINTPKEQEIDNDDELNDEFSTGAVSDGFDKVMNAKIGRTPILGLVSSFLGLLFIVIAAIVFSSRSDRVIDNVASGENNFISVIFLIFGLLLLIYGLYRVIGFGNPLKRMSDSINSVESGKPIESTPKKEDAEEKSMPKSDIPLDKESYKIGEFKIKDLKNKFKRSKKPTPPTQEELDQIPPAREKPADKKGLTAEEIEELEYQQAVRENESIDDIFAEVEDIDEIPRISVDSKDKQK
jgi:hypothetical protein